MHFMTRLRRKDLQTLLMTVTTSTAQRVTVGVASESRGRNAGHTYTVIKGKKACDSTYAG